MKVRPTRAIRHIRSGSKKNTRGRCERRRDCALRSLLSQEPGEQSVTTRALIHWATIAGSFNGSKVRDPISGVESLATATTCGSRSHSDGLPREGRGTSTFGEG